MLDLLYLFAKSETYLSASTSIDWACDLLACSPPKRSAEPTAWEPLNWDSLLPGVWPFASGSSPNKSADEIAFAFRYLSLSTVFAEPYDEFDLLKSFFQRFFKLWYFTKWGFFRGFEIFAVIKSWLLRVFESLDFFER